MQFEFDPSAPVVFEGWLQKANIGIFERWQKRYFRLQGRCIYYFKKDTGPEPPKGCIPIVDIDVHDLPPKKGRQFGFSIQLVKNPKMAKRAEYLISAETEEIRSQWKKIIREQCAYSIVGAPFINSCSVSPTSNHCSLLLPYFAPRLFLALDTTAYKTRGIWTVEVPTDFVTHGLGLLDQNLPLPVDDIHNAVAIVTAYLKALPSGLFPSEEMQRFVSKVTPADLIELLHNCPAPVRQFLRCIGMHFKKVLENTAINSVTQYSLLPILGPLLIRPPPNSNIPPAQVKSIQEQVAQCFISNAARILDDVHQFIDAPTQNVLYRARIAETMSQQGEDILDGSRGLLVNVVREDETGWCTVCTSNKRVGLLHKSKIRPLSQEEENELKSGPNIDEMMDVVREKAPTLILMFDSIIDETLKLRETLDLYEA